MKTTTIELALSAKGINKAIKQLEAYKKRIQKRLEQLIEVMCEQGETYAINSLGHIDTGLTLSTIFSYREGNRGVISAGGHAIWIEFGTGAKGLESSHPSGDWLNTADWNYCVGETIFFTANGKVGWYFPDDDGTWKFTEGIESQHFMYDAAMNLMRTFRTNAQKVFSK